MIDELKKEKEILKMEYEQKLSDAKKELYA